MIRDLALFAHSMLNARAIRPAKYYWDNTQQEQLDHVVDLLSNTQDPERVEIRRILTEVAPRRVLDAGCGPATELAGYREHGFDFEYIGLDGSQRMLDIARSKQPEATFVRGMLDKMPMKDGAFDVVLLKHVLEHLPTYEPVVSEAVRVANKAVVINLFHRLTPLGRDFHLQDRRGFWNNWYGRKKFLTFLDTLGLAKIDYIKTRGTAKQTAEIFVLRK